jgi:hypothetical protein
VPLALGTVPKRDEAYHWTMSGIQPECIESEPPNRSVAAEVLLRQEPEDDEDDEENEGDEKEDEADDDEEDDGYSE